MIFRERMPACLLLGAILIGYAGYKLYDPIGLPAAQYDRIKQRWSGCADMVACGDSRVMEAVSPAQMQKHIPDQTILNFSFLSNGFCKPFFHAVEKILRKESPHPSVLLGITPHSLTGVAGNYNQFHEFPAEHSWGQSLNRIQDTMDAFFATQSPSVFFKRLLSVRKTPPCWYSEYHPDGWVSAVKPHAPRFSLDSYRRTFQYVKVNPQIIEDLLDQVRDWRRRGISVYGFRPPTTGEMVYLENELSGFDQTNFAAKFHDAGGIWIDVNQTGYSSYDGSHLHREAAIAFSNDLAEAISRIREPSPIASNTPVSFP